MGPVIKSYKKVWVVNFLRLSYYSFILTLAVLICFGCQSVHEPSSISTAEGFPSDLSELSLRRAKSRVRCETKYPVNLHFSAPVTSQTGDLPLRHILPRSSNERSGLPGEMNKQQTHSANSMLMKEQCKTQAPHTMP